ncbi:hypothetical protein ANO11243_073140 [Dothideomycetidae sp. 11243]|nr:hypothetical protein ANO11243_073140 [fungal sp. No.11243]
MATKLFSGLPVALIAVLSVPIFLLTLFPLIASTSKSLDNIYLISLIWDNTVKPVVLLRVGYYGMCWKNSPADVCLGTSSRSAKTIVSKVFGPNPSQSADDIAGVQFALDLQRKVFVAFMTAGGLAWFFSLILVVLVIIAKGNAGASWRTVATWLASIGAILMVASAWSTTSGVRSLEVASAYLNPEPGFITGGNLLIGLQWAAAILTVIYAWAVSRVTSEGRKDDVYTYNMGR